MKFVLAGKDYMLETQESILKELGHKIVAKTTLLSQSHDLLKLNGYDGVVLAFSPEETITLLQNTDVKGSVYVYVESIDVSLWRQMAKFGVTFVTPGREKSIYPKEEQMNAEDATINIPERILEEDRRVRAEHVAQTERGPSAVLKKRILMVYSPKGGVGKTTFSVSSAYYLARHGYKVVVVDLDHSRSGSDIARKFSFFALSGRHPKRSVLAFHNFPMRDYADWRVVSEYVQSTPTGLPLYFVPSSIVNEDNIMLTKDLVQKMVSVLSHHFDIIIIDTGDDLREHNVEALKIAQEVFLIVPMGVDEIDAAYQFVSQDVPKMNIPLEKIKLLLTSVPDNRRKEAIDAATKTMLPLFGILPEDKHLRELRKEKVFVNDALLDTPYGQAMQKIVKQVVPISEVEKKIPWFKKLIKIGGR